MPIGPSHSSHSSGGGSHSGGGIHIGGGSHPRPSPSPGGHRNPPPPRRPFFRPRTFVWFGRPVVFSTGAFSSVLVLFIITILAAFISVVSFLGYSSNSSQIKKNNEQIAIYESDATYYANLISKAKSGESGYYLATATFTDTFYYSYNSSDFSKTGAYEYLKINGVVYYFIVYSYTNEVTGQTTKGETYTQFTSSAVRAMSGSIEIAYTLDSDGTYYSINTSYTLENNQDYNALIIKNKNLNSNMSSVLPFAIGAGVVALLLLIVIILVIRKTIKKSKAQAAIDAAKSQAEADEAAAKAQIAQAEADAKNRFCEYCGSKIPEDSLKCPSCGSRVTRK